MSLADLLLLTIIIISLSTVLASLSDQCGTPVECYAKAIDALNRDRQDMAKERDSYVKSLEQLNGKIDQLESDKNDLVQKLADIEKRENEDILLIKEDINNIRNIHICRTLETTCSSDGGGNFIYLDRHYIKCSNNEHIQSFHLERCSSNRVKYVYDCCKLP